MVFPFPLSPRFWMVLSPLFPRWRRPRSSFSVSAHLLGRRFLTNKDRTALLLFPSPFSSSFNNTPCFIVHQWIVSPESHGSSRFNFFSFPTEAERQSRVPVFSPFRSPSSHRSSRKIDRFFPFFFFFLFPLLQTKKASDPLFLSQVKREPRAFPFFLFV